MYPDGRGRRHSHLLLATYPGNIEVKIQIGILEHDRSFAVYVFSVAIGILFVQSKLGFRLRVIRVSVLVRNRAKGL